jgi:predicted dehydrogenase
MNAGSNDHGWEVDVSSWIWRMQEELSGGGELVFDDGNHKFSIARYFMGEPESVFAYIGKTPIEGAENININGKVMSFYEDAPSMITWRCKDSKRYGVFDITYSKDLEVNTDYYACDERVEITGSKGVLWVTRCTGKMLQIPTLIIYKDRKMFTYDDLRDDWADSFIDSTKDFIDAIKNDRDPVLTGEDGRKVLKFSLAAIESSKCNKPINIDEFDG